MGRSPPTVQRLPSVDSTSKEARRRVRLGLPVDGLALTTDDQTDGRGRRGTAWVMLPGRSLAFTFIRPRPAGVRVATLMARLAVAVCRGLEAAGAPPLLIKWPNDVLRETRKAAGLLVEVVADPDGREWLLLGLGANLWLRDLGEGAWPEGLPTHAGDAGIPPAPGIDDQVLRQLLAALDEALGLIGTPADEARGQEYVLRAWIRGRAVVAEHRGKRVATVVEDVSPDGDLTTRDGLVLQAEHVHLLQVEGLHPAD